MSKPTVPSWVKQASAEIAEQEANETKFFKFPEGETEILVNADEAPKVIEKTFKDKTTTRWQFEIVIVDTGETKTLEVGKQLYRKIVRAIAQDLNPMTVIRAGTDIHTSYGIKGLMK